MAACLSALNLPFDLMMVIGPSFRNELNLREIMD